MSRWKRQISSSMFLSYSFDKNHLYVLYSLSSVRSFLCVYVAETNLAALLYKNLCTQNKTKGLSQNESRAIVLLCTRRESGCIFSMRFFRLFLSRGWRRRNYAGLIHIPGCICRFALGFCKNIKKRTETLYQSFSPFMVERRGFEPLTSTMRTLRATNCANAPNFLGKFCADSPLTV